MIKYTTPTITLTIKGVDITDYQAYVTFVQGSHKLTKSGSDLDMTATTIGDVTYTQITLVLSQEESAAFDENQRVRVQVNWISDEGVRGATKIRKVEALANLLDEVIEYGD